MSDAPPKTGSVPWIDLTIPDAENVRAFYQKVIGWSAEPVDMGGYNDYCVNEPETGRTVAGICHARGPNEGLPAQWLIYITVKNLDESVSQCESLGGKVLQRRESAKEGRIAVIQDPAGAVAALFEPPG